MKTNIIKTLLSIACLLCSIAIWADNVSETNLTLAESIVLDHQSVTLKPSETTILTATILPETASAKKVIWSSSDDSVASVENGVVTAHKVGTADITASVSNNQWTATYKNSAINGISSIYAYVWDAGDDNKLYLGNWPGTLMNKNSDGTWSITLTAEMVSPMIIFNNGSVGGKNQTADLEFINNGVYNYNGYQYSNDNGVSNLSATCSVTVVALAESITLDKTEITMRASETTKLTATILPETTTVKDVVWTSSNDSVASVYNGIVTAHEVGVADISAKTIDGSELSVICKVTVEETLAESITLDKSEITLKLSETTKLTATILPETTTVKDVVWTSSNDSVASVYNGVVTAHEVGVADISAKTIDGSELSVICKVTVEENEALSYGTKFYKNLIYYEIIDSYNKKVRVTYRGHYYDSYSNEYAGSYIIPETIVYNGTKYSVTSIGSSAFEGCTGLTAVTIPNSVTSIGDYAFYDCTGLTAVTIGNSVTSIGEHAFRGCTGLTEVTFNAENCTTMGSSSEPVFKGCSRLTTLNIGEAVKNIPDYAFDSCTGLTAVTIPNSVTSIGEHAFRGCTGLTEVTIGNSVTSIGSSAFSGCSIIKTIWMTNTPPTGYGNVKSKVHYVANNQYSSLSNVVIYPYLSSLFVADGVKYVPVSPSERTCDAISCLYNTVAENIKIDSIVSFKGVNMTVKNVRPYTLYNNDYIKTLSIGANVNIGSQLCYDCNRLVNAELNNNGNIESEAFSECGSLVNLCLGNRVKSIGDYAFEYCSKIENIVIPDSVESIGSCAFRSCTSLASVVVGNGVTTIGTYGFSNCTNLKHITLGEKVEKIERDVFYNCTSLPEISIPQSVNSIGNYAFDNCTTLSDVIIEDRTTTLSLGSNGSNPLFADCPLDSVYIGGKITYNTSSSYGYSPFYRNTSLRTVVITDTEEEIYDNEFYGCSNLTDVTIGDGVRKIGNWAFSGCSNLDHFAFGSSVESIGEEAFSDCTNVSRIISYTHNPPICDTQALDDINKWSCTLHVHEDYLTAYQAADQWKDFFFVEGIESEGYKLIYIVDGEIYATERYFLGDAITPMKDPTKDGYIFSGWSEIPQTMPAYDVIVSGAFIFNPTINDNFNSYVIEEYTYCDEFTYIRDFDNTDWQAWYMPFEVAYSDLSSNFEVAYLNNVHQYDHNNDGEIDYTELEAIKVKDGVLKANYPYIVKSMSVGEQDIIIWNVTLQPTEVNSFDCSSMSHRYVFTGTYDKISSEEMVNNGYYSLNNNTLEKRTNDLGAFRWYLKIEDRGANNPAPQKVVLRVEDNLTAIDGVTNDSEVVEPIYYDLSGRIVDNPSSGIYIVKQGSTVRKVVL